MEPYTPDEEGEVLLDDGLDDPAVDRCQVDAEDGPEDEEDCEEEQIEDFRAGPAGDDDFDELFDPGDEDGIDISLSSLSYE
jgi:hypothetical protein